MGLLSDPSLTPRNKLGRNLAKHSAKICFVLYIGGLVWFSLLAHPDFNHGTYLSENALSPGLVYPEIKQDSARLAQTLLDDLRRERANYKSSMPVPWITAKMKQLGLETHVHNFTLNYPFSGDKPYHGTNVYGILRAPRSSSTEGLVFSVPYRPPNSVHEDIVASVPLLLAFADFARRKNYWAKDIVFLVSDQEQLGTFAWLEAYYAGESNSSKLLSSGNVPVRAGALQAAINLEIQDLDIDRIDVKIEGLNGQLPNLDLFNLVQRITSREGIQSSYKKASRKKHRSESGQIENNLRHIISMLLSQATGVPTGNHGLFHQYRVEALTMVGVRKTTYSESSSRQPTTLSLLRSLEGISRSLNNLLERFHQSYFFYILVQNDRFVSIGDYMPALVLVISPLFIKAFLLWLTAGEDEEEVNDEKPAKDAKNQLSVDYLEIAFSLGIALAIGFLCYSIPTNPVLFRDILISTFGSINASLVATVIAGVSIVSYLCPLFIRYTRTSRDFIHILSALFFAVALIAIGLMNFSLSFFVGVISVPMVIAIPKTVPANGARKVFSCLYAALLNPIIVVYVAVLITGLFQQLDHIKFDALILRAWQATLDAIAFAFMDCMIYGNWLYTVATIVFLPLWIIFWTLSTCSLKIY